MATKVLLNKDIQKKIIKHCLRCYPKEACGVLVGRDNKAEILYHLENVSADPEFCYEIDSRQNLKLSKQIRAKGLSIIVIYHSHVNTEAYPSARDVGLAYYPESFYVIVSLKDKDNPEVRAFKISGGEITKADIIS